LTRRIKNDTTAMSYWLLAFNNGQMLRTAQADLRMVFDNQPSAFSAQQSAKAPRGFLAVTTLCRPNSKNGKIGLKIGSDSTAEKREKRLRQLGRQYCRIGVGPLFSIKRLWGVGLWLRDTGRGP